MFRAVYREIISGCLALERPMRVAYLGPEGTFTHSAARANFGLSAAVLEMLVYTAPGIMKLLPALPESWPVGKARGILCRGGIEVSVQWNMHKGTVEATLRSTAAQEITLKLPGAIRRLSSSLPRSAVVKSPRGPSYRQLRLPAKKNVTISAALEK